MSTQTVAETLKSFAVPTLDFAALIASHNRTLEAVAEAQKVAMNGYQGVAKRHEEILRAAMSDLQSAVKDAKSPEKYAAVSTDLAKKAFEQSRELAELFAKANQDALAVVAKRGQESLAEIKAMITPVKA